MSARKSDFAFNEEDSGKIARGSANLHRWATEVLLPMGDWRPGSEPWNAFVTRIRAERAALEAQQLKFSAHLECTAMS